MKFHIEAERRQFLSMVVEAATQTEAEEAARMAPMDCWDHEPEEDDRSLTEVREADPEEEAFWRVTAGGELEPYDEEEEGNLEG